MEIEEQEDKSILNNSNIELESDGDNHDDDEKEEIQTRQSFLKLFGRIENFQGRKYLTKCTDIISPPPVIDQEEEKIYEKHPDLILKGQFNDELKHCLVICQKSNKKLGDMISTAPTYPSIFISEAHIPKIYMSMIDLKHMIPLEKYKEVIQSQQFQEELLLTFKNNFTQNFSMEEYQKFIAKKEKRQRKKYHPERRSLPPKIGKSSISKTRVYIDYTSHQIQQVEYMVRQERFKNYQGVSLQTGIKISLIQKIASKLSRGQPARKQRSIKDSVNTFTQAQKDQMIQEAVKKELACLNLKEKMNHYNKKFNVEIQYSTY